MGYIVFGCLFLVFGLLELVGWFFSGEGMIGGFIFSKLQPNYPWLANFALFKNPFIATYLILPSAWLLADPVRENALSRWSLMANPHLKLVSTILKVVCGLMLALIIWIIVRFFVNGWNFDSNSQNFLMFSLAIISVFFLKLFLTNLPIPKTPVQPILGVNVTGLYSFKNDQFALEEVPGDTEVLNPIGRWFGKKVAFKDKQSLWFVFSKGARQFPEEKLPLEVGILQANYSWWADVSNSPKSIILEDISLSGIESPDDLKDRMLSGFVDKFRDKVLNQSEYKSILREIESMSSNSYLESYQNSIIESSNFAYSPEEAVDFFRKYLLSITIKINNHLEKLRQAVNYSPTFFERQENQMYGGLFAVGFKLDKLDLSQETKANIAEYKEKSEKQYQEWYDRLQKSFEDVKDVLKIADGHIPRETFGRTTERLLEAAIESSKKRSAEKQVPVLVSGSMNSEKTEDGSSLVSEEGMNIETIMQGLESILRKALYHSASNTIEAIKFVLPAISISRASKHLDISEKINIFDEWLLSKQGKLKSGNAKDVLRSFIQDQMNIGNQVYLAAS